MDYHLFGTGTLFDFRELCLVAEGIFKAHRSIGEKQAWKKRYVMSVFAKFSRKMQGPREYKWDQM